MNCSELFCERLGVFYPFPPEWMISPHVAKVQIWSLIGKGYSHFHGYIWINYEMLDQIGLPKSQLDDPPRLAQHTFHPEERVS